MESDVEFVSLGLERELTVSVSRPAVIQNRLIHKADVTEVQMHTRLCSPHSGVILTSQ